MKRLFKQLFVPQEKNNFRAKLLHPSVLALLVGVFLFNQTFLNLIALTKPGILGYISDITPEAIVDLTNQIRLEENLPPLEMNSLLNESAQRKAADMFAFDYWSHDSPSGRSPWDFLKEVDYQYLVAGENLAKDFSNPNDVVRAWAKSPTHKANIADARFAEIGVAVIEGTLNGFKTTLVVQHFGKTEGKAGSRIGVQAREKVNSRIKGEEFSVPKQVDKVINPLMVTKIISAALFGLIILAVLIDAIFIAKTGAHRLSGRNLAHAIFLGLIFLLILLSQQGVIN